MLSAEAEEALRQQSGVGYSQGLQGGCYDSTKLSRGGSRGAIDSTLACTCVRRREWEGGKKKEIDTGKEKQRYIDTSMDRYWGGLTRIAVRKYTSFGVHPAGKHLGNGPGMLPNINYLSVYMGIQHFGYASVMLPSTSCWSVHMGVSR